MDPGHGSERRSWRRLASNLVGLLAQAEAGTGRSARTIWPARRRCAGRQKGTDPVRDVTKNLAASIPTWRPARPSWFVRVDTGLADDHEGKQVLQWLNSVELLAFVSKYCSAALSLSGHAPQDAGCAIGWSARCIQLGLMIGSRSSDSLPEATWPRQPVLHSDAWQARRHLPIERVSSRPDRMILVIR